MKTHFLWLEMEGFHIAKCYFSKEKHLDEIHRAGQSPKLVPDMIRTGPEEIQSRHGTWSLAG